MIKGFETSKGEFLAVKVPDDAKNFWINSIDCIRYTHSNGNVSSVIEPIDIGFIPDRDNSIIGLAYEIREEQAKEIVDSNVVVEQYTQHVTTGAYKNYLGEMWYWSALESFNSLMRSNEIFSENPLGQKPQRRTPFKSRGNYTENDYVRIEEYHAELKDWETKQNNVGNWLILKKL